MAYDFGTNTLGIQNPFKPEGVVKVITGSVICLLGIMPLLGVAQDLKTDMVLAWLHAGLGLILLIWGLKHMGTGLFQLFRYFVGRSVPTSLAYNFNPSEKDNAEVEKSVTQYDAQDIESMLMGRKNSTFSEPLGWIARLIHSLFPKLVFTPYPIRNFVQELAGLVTSSIVALTAFGVAYFVSVSGLAGNAGSLITPILSVALLLYLTTAWWMTARSLTSAKNRALHSKNATGIAKLLAFSIIVPVLIGFGYSKIEPAEAIRIQDIFDQVIAFSAWTNLALLMFVSLAVIAASWVMINERFKLANPLTEVCEFRDNMQESVHPNEIFINIENIVLANRRFKEIPNRLYQAFDPVLQEQSQGKGSFKGQLLIETQPEFQKMEYGPLFKTFRLVSTVAAQLLIIVAAILLASVVESAYDIYHFADIELAQAQNVDESLMAELLDDFGVLIASFLTILFSWLTVLAGGKILAGGTFLFWSEMQFSSLLMWMKTEGTFTESKISTGMSIHDSTRSENVVVRSSITPWIITSRIVTSTFAVSGAQNLEMPRYIMQMAKNPDEIEQIVSEIKAFLRDREAIASITNERDLGNAETIYQVNQASRANMGQLPRNPDQIKLEEQAAGKLIQDQESDEANRNS